MAVSHVLWATGAVLPIAGIAEIAHARGALVVVDGAQGAGAIPVELAATGADVYAVSAQKWLLGPEGMGAIAVAPGVRDRLQPSFGGYFSFETVDPAGAAVRWPDARRFESSNFHRPSIVGMARSIGWLSMFVGLDWVYERGAAMARLAADRLAADRRRRARSRRATTWPPSSRSGSPAGRPRRRSMSSARGSSRSRGPCRTSMRLRISVGFFTSEEELDRFIEAVALLAAHTPATLPPRRRLTILGEG